MSAHLRTLAVIIVASLLSGGCGAEKQPERASGVTQVHERAAIFEEDGPRVGHLLHERGLISHPEVFAQAKAAAASGAAGGAASDSAVHAFRVWLDRWVVENPEKVAAAEAARPRQPTAEQLARDEGEARALRAEELRFRRKAQADSTRAADSTAAAGATGIAASARPGG